MSNAMAQTKAQKGVQPGMQPGVQTTAHMETQGKIFIVEDDAVLAQELQRILRLQGYDAWVCEDFSQADAEAVALHPDAIVLDLNLPGADGLSICRNVRAQSDVPILVLTSSDDEFDEVMSLKIGADGYLTKPYSPAVLLAHVERMLKRSGRTEGTKLCWQGLELDASQSLVCFGGRSAVLTRNEMRILSALMRAEGRIVSRQDLMCELWQSDEFIDDNTLTVNVNRLRKTLETLGVPADLLRTHRGQGYSL